MSFLDGLRYRLRTFFRRARTEAERAEEIRFHLSLDAMHQAHEGRSADAARLAARRRFGNVTGYRQDVRQLSGGARLDALARDLRAAFRRLGRDRGFTVAAVLTLGLGIGALGGIGAALPIIGLMRGLLFGVRAIEPGVVLAVCAAVVVIAGAACYVPARRAGRLDPVEVLRAD